MNENKTNINWFPGHMVTAKKEIKENLKLIDIVIEIIDARIPQSSKNPDFEELLLDKPRIIVLNKSDMADERANREWMNWFKKQGIPAVLVSASNGYGLRELTDTIFSAMESKIKENVEKGRIGRTIRAMVAGIPNSGKSSFINKVAGRNIAEVGNKPGVTRNKRWVKTSIGIELMDTPGILQPKFENENIAINLALTGAINFDILDNTELVLKLIGKIKKNHTKEIEERYKIDNIKEDEPLEIYEKIAAKRGCLLKGGEIDYEKAANIIMDEFRKGMIGRISLELPEKE